MHWPIIEINMFNSIFLIWFLLSCAMPFGMGGMIALRLHILLVRLFGVSGCSGSEGCPLAILLISIEC